MSKIQITDAKHYLFTQVLPEIHKITREYFATGGGEHTAKSEIDLATQADYAIDELLRTRLAERFPESNFLTEETAPDDYSDLKDTSNLWVIDPIDGTVNFSRKIENFAVSVALVEKGKVRLGVVYQPIQDYIFWASEEEDQAYKNDEPIQVAPTTELNRALIQSDMPWSLEKRLLTFEMLAKLSQQVRLLEMPGSAVMGMVAVAEGKTDAYVQYGAFPCRPNTGVVFRYGKYSSFSS